MPPPAFELLPLLLLEVTTWFVLSPSARIWLNLASSATIPEVASPNPGPPSCAGCAGVGGLPAGAGAGCA